MFSAQVRDHFEHPRNAGTLEAADAMAKLSNPACGDVLQLIARLTEGRIVEIRFQANGCVATIACGSALTGLVEGKTIAEARMVSREKLLRALEALPPASMHATHLAVDTLKALLDQLQTKA